MLVIHQEESDASWVLRQVHLQTCGVWFKRHATEF